MKKKKSPKLKSGFYLESDYIVPNSVKFEDEVKICPRCGKPFKGWGNNPYPLDCEEPVCDECNLHVVIPLRLFMALPQSKKEEILKMRTAAQKPA